MGDSTICKIHSRDNFRQWKLPPYLPRDGGILPYAQNEYVCKGNHHMHQFCQGQLGESPYAAKGEGGLLPYPPVLPGANICIEIAELSLARFLILLVAVTEWV